MIELKEPFQAYELIVLSWFESLWWVTEIRHMRKAEDFTGLEDGFFDTVSLISHDSNGSASLRLSGGWGFLARLDFGTYVATGMASSPLKALTSAYLEVLNDRHNNPLGILTLGKMLRQYGAL